MCSYMLVIPYQNTMIFRLQGRFEEYMTKVVLSSFDTCWAYKRFEIDNCLLLRGYLKRTCTEALTATANQMLLELCMADGDLLKTHLS